jgi:hypothetical protein
MSKRCIIYDANSYLLKCPGGPCSMCRYWRDGEMLQTNGEALTRQIGGSHYTGFKFQPVEFITANKLSFLQGSIIKRICRYNKEGARSLQDLEKAKHEIDLIIQLEDIK